jgi:hypothetical protein
VKIERGSARLANSASIMCRNQSNAPVASENPNRLGDATALTVQRIRAGDHLSLFPRRWNYF